MKAPVPHPLLPSQGVHCLGHCWQLALLPTKFLKLDSPARPIPPHYVFRRYSSQFLASVKTHLLGFVRTLRLAASPVSCRELNGASSGHSISGVAIVVVPRLARQRKKEIPLPADPRRGKLPGPMGSRLPIAHIGTTAETYTPFLPLYPGVEHATMRTNN